MVSVVRVWAVAESFSVVYDLSRGAAVACVLGSAVASVLAFANLWRASGTRPVERVAYATGRVAAAGDVAAGAVGLSVGGAA